MPSQPAQDFLWNSRLSSSPRAYTSGPIHSHREASRSELGSAVSPNWARLSTQSLFCVSVRCNPGIQVCVHHLLFVRPGESSWSQGPLPVTTEDLREMWWARKYKHPEPRALRHWINERWWSCGVAGSDSAEGSHLLPSSTIKSVHEWGSQVQREITELTGENSR